MLWFSFTLLALFASVQGRAVNISNTWVLPEEGFPVFYRYFRDRISWYEADAVCQFHHANLVTVDTTAQYDAVRAYLKELDISSAVWVGLIRSNPDGDFTWTDYRGLSGEGYWSSAPDARAAPLCAAADPAADYRWEARACGGPTVASFICELPVPQWALGKDGCMVRALPALTALYLPESAAVQLTADCGLARVKRVQCTGNVKREELLKDLSCNDEDDSSSTLSVTSTSSVWPATETTFTEQELTTDELSTVENIVTEQKSHSGAPTHVTESPSTYNVNSEPEIHTTPKHNLNIHDFVIIPLNKEINLEPIHNNDIPQAEPEDNLLNNHHLKIIEENKSYQHRLLHGEMTRLGNLETIFTQPTDHFVPPLVMAKARISDDMTVLSLEEKHAQQVAEQRLYKHNKIIDHPNITPSQDSIHTSVSSTLAPTKIVKEHKATDASISYGNTKKDLKSTVPKKYIEKYNNPKANGWRTADYKLQRTDKIDLASPLQTSSSTQKIETTTNKLQTEIHNDSEEDPTIDLTVIIKEPGTGNSQQIFYTNRTNTMVRSEQVATSTETDVKETESISTVTEMPTLTTNPVTENKSQGTSTVTLNHEVIKITVINASTSSSNSSPVVFEVSTLMPVFDNNSGESDFKSSPIVAIRNNTNSIELKPATISNDPATSTTVLDTSSSSTQSQQSNLENNRYSTSVPSSTNNIVTDKEDFISTTELPVMTQKPTQITTESATLATTTLLSIENATENDFKNVTATEQLSVTLREASTTEKMDIFNHTDNFEEEHEHDEHDTEAIDDYQSPLLSAANEPLHRPNRSRRPMAPPNRMNKFNPFRILG